MVSSARFTKEHRLRRGTDFQRVYQGRCSVADDCLIVYGLFSDRDHCRLGLSVSRKVGPAVLRNRWKRHIREAFRRQQPQWQPSLDLIVMPRRGATADAHRVAASLGALVPRLQRKLKSRKRGALPKES